MQTGVSLAQISHGVRHTVFQIGFGDKVSHFFHRRNRVIHRDAHPAYSIIAMSFS
jgi:hypothetical protein